MMLDEFPALGRLDFFETALAFMAGYGIRAYLIAQSPQSDLQGLRREQRHPRQLPCADRVLVERRAHGEADLRRAGHGDRASRAAQLRGSSALALAQPCHGQPQETARPLLTPGEVMQLPPADELVLVSGLAPIRAKKLRYYEDGNFTARVSAVPQLGDGGYRDRPKPRPNDWGGQVRGQHGELASVIDDRTRRRGR